MKYKKILLVQGGISSEREISLRYILFDFIKFLFDFFWNQKGEHLTLTVKLEWGPREPSAWAPPSVVFVVFAQTS